MGGICTLKSQYRVNLETWQTGKYFFRQYSHEDKPKRISEQEYMSAYEEYRNY